MMGIAFYQMISSFLGDTSVAFSLATGHPLSRIFVFIMGICGGLIVLEAPESTLHGTVQKGLEFIKATFFQVFPNALLSLIGFLLGLQMQMSHLMRKSSWKNPRGVGGTT